MRLDWIRGDTHAEDEPNPKLALVEERIEMQQPESEKLESHRSLSHVGLEPVDCYRLDAHEILQIQLLHRSLEFGGRDVRRVGNWSGGVERIGRADPGRWRGRRRRGRDESSRSDQVDDGGSRQSRFATPACSQVQRGDDRRLRP